MASELIVGLDVPGRAEAESLVEQLDGVADFFKIGYQLVYGGDGLALGRDLLAAGKRVFFDLKLLDIDNTVAHGVAAIAATGATMLTVHAYPRTMEAAVRAARGSALCILGVSVLTSMDEADVAAAGYGLSVEDLVARRAGQAREAGMGGLVASALEAARIREIVGPDMAVVTPGIRLAGEVAGDQKRVVTPSRALAAGASHLVVARPIINAPDPRGAAQAVLADMALARQSDTQPDTRTGEQAS